MVILLGFPEKRVGETRACISANRGRDPLIVQTTALPVSSVGLSFKKKADGLEMA
jgi:hypothetical protein